MLTKSQKYSIATMLATNSIEQVKNRPSIKNDAEALIFIEEIARFYKKIDGFIPRKVLNLIYK